MERCQESRGGSRLTDSRRGRGSWSAISISETASQNRSLFRHRHRNNIRFGYTLGRFIHTRELDRIRSWLAQIVRFIDFKIDLQGPPGATKILKWLPPRVSTPSIGTLLPSARDGRLPPESWTSILKLNSTGARLIPMSWLDVFLNVTTTGIGKPALTTSRAALMAIEKGGASDFPFLAD